MNGCGKILGNSGPNGIGGYNMKCGCFWNGDMVYCDKCERENKEDELMSLKIENEKLLRLKGEGK